MVLLDGDGIIFRDDFLQQGGQGGRNAATKLQTALRNYIAKSFPRIASPKIITKLYVNVKGLADLCVRGGVTTEPSLIEEFVRGFNGGFPLLELIDTGCGKNSAHDKIAGTVLSLCNPLASLLFPTRRLTACISSFSEAFHLYLYNCHCHQVLLGCSQDAAYMRKLEDMLHDTDLMGRVSLIEGLAFEKTLDLIKSTYRVTRFPELFRDSRISVWAPWKAAVASKPRTLFTPSPVQQAIPLSRTSTNTTSTTHSVPLSVASSSANSASIGEFQIVRSKSSNSSPKPKVVGRNKYGQRVDRTDFKNFPREEVNRIKKLKLCNFYFLLGECPIENCLHDHSHKLTKSELLVLKVVARMTPCRYGTECDDPECMYGHRCPHSEPGKSDCYWGSTCRFEPSAHGIDLNIVKVTKV